jgi:hypothetical protein
MTGTWLSWICTDRYCEYSQSFVLPTRTSLTTRAMKNTTITILYLIRRGFILDWRDISALTERNHLSQLLDTILILGSGITDISRTYLIRRADTFVTSPRSADLLLVSPLAYRISVILPFSPFLMTTYRWADIPQLHAFVLNASVYKMRRGEGPGDFIEI